MIWIPPLLSLLALPVSDRRAKKPCRQRRGSPLQIDRITYGASNHDDIMSASSSSSPSRRQFVTKFLVASVASLPAWAVAADDGMDVVTVTLQSPQDRLGLELFDVEIGSPPRRAVAIRSISASRTNARKDVQSHLQAGMVLVDFDSMEALKSRLQNGQAYPVTLSFRNLAAGGDALAETGVPLVTAQDALTLARSSAMSSDMSATATMPRKNNSAIGYQIQVLTNPKPTCKIQSRRNDVLEIQYTARYYIGNKDIVYDSSEERGTGQAYQMVLGSGDMLNGVDLGLYEMCPGEKRQITIPPRLAYGEKGNRLFGIPPDQTLVWNVELIRINGVVGNDERSRDEMEARVPYSTFR